MDNPFPADRLRITAIMLLLIIGINALAAGYGFMADPSGAGLGITTDYLRHSPFSNFFIPGIVLFAMIGMLSFLAAIIVILRERHYQDLIFLQGMILVAWIIIQMILVRDINLLHIACLVIGYALTRLGREMTMSLGSGG